MNLFDIIGLKVLTIRSFCTDRRIKRNLEPVYILFDDGETYIELSEQDYYAYHDCSSAARHVYVYKDKIAWKQMFDNEHGYYPEANIDNLY